MKTMTELWRTALELLRKQYTETTINTFFAGLEVAELENDTIIMTTEHSVVRNVINEKYIDVLSKCWEEVFSTPMKVLMMTNEEYQAYLEGKEEQKGYDTDEFLFSTFVVGSSNRFAHAAATAVADMPAQVYNPLLIHGPSGVGKTHLLYAIANKIKSVHPNWRILYIPAEDFTNELIASVSKGSTADFRAKYRQLNLLLVDDVQFIAGKAATQEEFFHTFNALFEARHQIVLTSDRPPKEINMLEERLRTRFESGLLADIQPPDLETRSAIVLAKSEYLHIDLPKEVTSFFAENITSNVRQLEGAVKKMKALNSFMGMPLDMETAKLAIEDIFRENPGLNPTPEYIIETVAAFYNLSPADLTGTRRGQEIMRARQVAIYLTRNITKHSLPEIGTFFGGRDHTTIMHSISKIEQNLKTDKTLKANIETLLKSIRQV